MWRPLFEASQGGWTTPLGKLDGYVKAIASIDKRLGSIVEKG